MIDFIGARAPLALVSTLLIGVALPATASAAGQQTAQKPATSDQAVADDGGVEEIVVTARLRAEPLQQTPLAISAISPQRLAEARVRDISDLTSLAPSLTLVRDAAVASRVIPFMRGFGNRASDPAADPAIAIAIDGFYAGAQIGTFINLFDVEGVEVLRGPQGTLLGRNSPSGALLIRTRRPKPEFGGMAQVDYGSYNNFEIRGYVDVPLGSDKVSGTISYFRAKSDGFTRNLVTGTRVGGAETQSFRVGLLAEPTDRVSLYLTAQYDSDKGEDSSTRNVSDFVPLRIPTANYTVSSPPLSRTCQAPFAALVCANGLLPNRQYNTTYGTLSPKRDSWGYNVTSDASIDGDAVNFKWISGLRYYREFGRQDIDGTQQAILDITFDGRYRTVQQEVRLSSMDSGPLSMDGRLNWLVGAFYFNFDYDRTALQVALNNPAKNNQHQQTNSYALFGHIEYKITDQFIASFGARQTWDRKNHDSRSATFYATNGASDKDVIQSAAWKNFSVDATVEYRFDQHKMIFGRYSEGYRGGGFAGVPSSAAAAAQVKPETVQSYEIGLKTEFFDRRLQFNVTGYIAKYSDLQRIITSSTPLPPFLVQIPRNVASATTKGFEIEATARPIDALALRLGVGYVQPRYTSYIANLTGVAGNGPSDNRALTFPYISDWTVSVGGAYTAALGKAGSLRFNVDYDYRSKFNTTDQSYAFSKQPGYGLVNAGITWRDAADRLNLSVYGKNLSDTHYIDGGDATGGVTSFVQDGPPRTFGVSAGLKF